MASFRRALRAVAMAACIATMLQTASSYRTSETCGHTIGPYFWTDVFGLENATNLVIAKPNDDDNFGLLSYYNDPLALGPNADDEIIGRAEGTYLLTSNDGTSGPMAFTFVFPKGTITFTGYLYSQQLLPPSFNRYGIIAGSGIYSNISRGYTDNWLYESAFDGNQIILTGTVSYCVESEESSYPLKQSQGLDME